MKYPTENSKKYPGLEQLSTPELEELLRRDFATSEDDEASMVFLTEIMEVIRSREAQVPSPIDEDTAWETFLSRNVTPAANLDSPPAPEPEPATTPEVIPFPQKRERKPRRKLRWYLSFAAVLCLVVCFFILPAAGTDPIGALIQWSTHTFSFSPGGAAAFRLDDATYDQLKNKVDELTDLPVLPTRYPEGSELVQAEDSSSFLGNGVDFVFSSSKGGFSISITAYHDASELPTGQYEKDPGPPEEYYANGIPHYIAKNIDTYIAVWRNENVECCIQGNLSVDELKAMIDSIYD